MLLGRNTPRGRVDSRRFAEEVTESRLAKYRDRASRAEAARLGKLTMILTNNVLQRVLCIRQGQYVGTAFTIDHDARQYIVTARHVVDGVASGGSIAVRHERRWVEVPIAIVGLGNDETDVAVLAHAKPVTPSYSLRIEASFRIGQSVAFVGFPFGWDSGSENINNGFPIPFVKAGIISGWVDGPRSRIYVDAHGNPGFSGGPLVLRNESGELAIIGIITDAPNDPITGERTGFVCAIGTRWVLNLIEAKPIGAQVSI